jgi:hypothetical protein
MFRDWVVEFTALTLITVVVAIIIYAKLLFHVNWHAQSQK